MSKQTVELTRMFKTWVINGSKGDDDDDDDNNNSATCVYIYIYIL